MQLISAARTANVHNVALESGCLGLRLLLCFFVSPSSLDNELYQLYNFFEYFCPRHFTLRALYRQVPDFFAFKAPNGASRASLGSDQYTRAPPEEGCAHINTPVTPVAPAGQPIHVGRRSFSF